MFGQSITFTALVTVAAGERPGGMVDFRDGSTDLGTVALNGGRASLTTAALSMGPHGITALTWAIPITPPAQSSVLTRTVNKAAARTTLSASPYRSTAGQPVTIKATVRAVGPGAGVPGGAVQFVDYTNGGTKLGARWAWSAARPP